MTNARCAAGLPSIVADMDESSPAARMATSRQRGLALGICMVLTLTTILLFPFAKVAWPKIPAFLAMNQTAIFGMYLVTAYLMFGHYKASGSAALLHLSAGCAYTASVLVIQFCSFSGVFMEGRVLLGSSQSSTWLWLLWHVGPAVSILLYSWSELRRPASVSPNYQQSIRVTALALGLAILATAAMVTTFHDWLPILDVRGDFSRLSSSGVAPALQVLLVLSLVFLWRASRFRNVLHLWLGLTLVALLCDVSITVEGASRLTLGWYLGRFSALVSSSAMMLVYLKEINRSHQQSMLTIDKLGYAQRQIIEQLREEIKVRKLAEGELQHSYIQLLQLSDHQESIKNEERRRIAIDIHDDLGQTMMALKIDVSMLQARNGQAHPIPGIELQRLLDTIDSAIKSVRAIINDLHPSALELGLCAAVEWLLKQVERRHAIECKLVMVADSASANLDQRRTAAIFRIVQESLVNIVRHAHASEIRVVLDLNAESISILIEDNGIGIQPGDRSKTKSFGLKGIKQRIDAFGGELQIDSGHGKGTRLSIHMPLKTGAAAFEQMQASSD